MPAILLLEHLTKPTLKLKESFRLSEGSTERGTVTDVEIDVAGSDFWLQEAWTSQFNPHLDRFARRLAPMVTSHLMTVELVLKSFQKVNANWDPISSSRGMIESRQQDHLYSGMSVLLDIAAAVMSWACRNDPGLADALIDQWAAAESLILQRLAIFGVSIAPHVSADNKLAWLLQRRFLYRPSIKHETFLLMQAAYPHASPASRTRLLEQVLEGPEWKSEHQDIAEYEVFNVVVWLARADPSCGLAAHLLAQLKEQHPDYGVREHPDMDSWIGSVGAVGWQSPMPSEDLLSYDIDQLQEAVANVPATGFPHTDSREGLLWQIAECARKSIPWGLEIARQVQVRSLWSIDIWNALIGGWTSTDLTEEHWKTILDILDSSPAIHGFGFYNITSLLERGIQSTSAPIPIAMLQQAKSLADQVWPLCEQMDPGENGGPDGWVGRAINHPAGRLMDFYVRALSKLQLAGSATGEAVREYERVFATAVEGRFYGDELARVVLASQMHFLFYISEDWTVQHLFPVLDAALGVRRAEQCWQGFLWTGRWSDAMLKHLLGYYEGRFPLLRNESDDILRSFCSHLAGIATYALVHPLEQGWLLRFLGVIEAKARVVWASQMRFVMRGLDEAAKADLWRRWLRDYWERRVQGMPLPLDSHESAAMLEWALNLGPVFPEAVDLVCAGPTPDLGNSMVYLLDR